jgi:hypothetical protein
VNGGLYITETQQSKTLTASGQNETLIIQLLSNEKEETK